MRLPLRRWFRACCGLLLALYSLPAWAQEATPTAGGDVVVLKDGTEVRGTVLRQEPGQFVIVRTDEGREVTLSWEEVRRVERGSAAPVSPEPAAPPAAPAPPPAPVPAAEAPAQVPVAGAGPSTTARLDGLGLSQEVTFEEAESRRRAWLSRGGGIVGFEVRGHGMFVLLPPVAFQHGASTVYVSPLGGVSTSSTLERRERRGIGGGGGIGGRIAYMALSLPDPALGGAWTALRVASGVDFSYAYIGFPTQKVDVRQSSGAGFSRTDTVYTIPYQGTSLLLVNVPLQLGGMVGLGSFDGAEWRGVALSASWSPSLSYVKPGEGDGSSDINLAGFELAVDILGKDGPLDASAPRAHGKVFAFLLPPLGDLPLVATLGGGAVWY